MPKWAKIVSLLAVVQLSFVGLYYLTKERDAPSPKSRAGIVEVHVETELDEPLPDGRYRALSGELVEVSSGEKPLVIHFWGTWCPPCVDELPKLLAHDDVAVLAVAVDDDRESLEAFFDGDIPDSVVLSDGLERTFDVERLPATFLVSPDSRLVRRWDGARDWDASEWRTFTR